MNRYTIYIYTYIHVNIVAYLCSFFSLSLSLPYTYIYICIYIDAFLSKRTRWLSDTGSSGYVVFRPTQGWTTRLLALWGKVRPNWKRTIFAAHSHTIGRVWRARGGSARWGSLWHIHNFFHPSWASEHSYPWGQRGQQGLAVPYDSEAMS